MELTGKCKEEFEEWLAECFDIEEKPLTVSTSYEGDLEIYVSENFNMLHESMKYGVLVDYFDSVGMILEVSFYWGAKYWNVEISLFNDFGDTYLDYSSDCNDKINNRPEARTEAIEKANELRNEQLK